MDEERTSSPGTTHDSLSVSSLEQQAYDARMAGDYDRAALLFAEAASMCAEEQESLHLEMRRAYCLIAVDNADGALDIAQRVAQRARGEGFLPELADALGVIVDHHTQNDRLADAAHVLAEAMYALERLPDDPAVFQVMHNLAVTYSRCGFVHAALELYDRALRLADNEADKQFTYSNMAVAYHFAALAEPDDAARDALLHDGLYAATAALDPQGGAEIMATGLAMAHRSMMLAEIGHFDAALRDAQRARLITSEHGMREEQVAAMCGEVVSRWGLSKDASVLDLIAETYDLASEVHFEDILQPIRDVEVDILWTMEKFECARTAMRRNTRQLMARIHQESSARWEHVRLGVEHKRVEAISESDPLTGLPNRRYLGHWLPEVFEEHPPVCVGVVDLDGFKQINDDFNYEAGDRVLQEVATLLERVCRRGDAVVRIGGDEFVMVLREASLNDARVVFERIRQLIATHTWSGLPRDVTLTASVGVAAGSGSFDSARVLAAATEAMQAAKRTGRNRITFH